ncbi:NUDIX hydrolase domain-like protein [Absidia repens]|uniref:NAD-capped RNA hydrolase NUDT12 n=1 Tax=Absidia repens TaxID=90262 RepID=A0A1X2I127_9FUNG|nr:NUDIX hydrolase domain-like protein [Absidia repens]
MSASLLEAAATGDLDTIKSQTKALKDRNERGWTALHFAARYGQLEVATYLRDQAPDLLAVVNNEGKTPAQLAQFWGYDQVAQLLTPATNDDKQQQQQQQPAAGASGPVALAQQVNHVNFFAGSPLNRYGWYRTNNDKLNQLVKASNARFILLNKLDPLFDQDNKLYFAPYDQVAGLIGEFSDDTTTEDSLRPRLIFLGVDEQQHKDDSKAAGAASEGIPYWALDVSAAKQETNPFHSSLQQLHQDFEKNQLDFSPALPLAFQLNKDTAAILAQARSMMDWHTRNKFCPACGGAVVSKEAGHKLHCSSSDCISQKGVHNFAYPRTDAVVIVCIVHPTEDKILLGRQKQWPARMFSCIAGFVEAGESIEEAVRREALEETGVHVDHVSYHSTQPWPFPNSLMFGFLASATSTTIKMEDKELESARWFSRSEVLGALKGDGGVFTMPPKLAIAHQLVHAWATNATVRQNAKM